MHILLYTLPGIPSVYYGSEFGIEGRKERGSDYSLRPELSYEEYKNLINYNPRCEFARLLNCIKRDYLALSYGDYKELQLTNCQFAFLRSYSGQNAVVAVNNSDSEYTFTLSDCGMDVYTDLLNGNCISSGDGKITVNVAGNGGTILVSGKVSVEEAYEIPDDMNLTDIQVCKEEYKPEITEEGHKNDIETKVVNKPYEEMTVSELQAAILDKMSKNGPVTEQMKKDVFENVYHNSLINWVKSFR